MTVYIFYMILFIVSATAVMDWYSRLVFLARGYPRRYGHGKSWGRATKHYKANWSFVKRILWIPVFKEWYETKFRFLAYLAYVHFSIGAIFATVFLIDELLLFEVYFWHYFLFAFVGITLFRFVYADYVAIGKI